MTLLLDRVTFGYRRWTRPVLADFTYEVPEQGLTILLGPNGAGKSTTMALLAGTAEPKAGSVVLSGTDLTSASREYRRHVAWLPQRVPTSRQLTAREYELLVFMAHNARRALSRDILLSRVWELDFGATNVVDVYIGYLRKKIDLPGEKRLIHTVRGAGYALRGD